MEHVEYERRRKAFLRKAWLIFAVEALGAAGTGLGLGLAEQSAGWGLAGVLAFGIATVVGSFVGVAVIGGRTTLSQVGGVYGRAARRTTLGRVIPGDRRIQTDPLPDR